MARSPWERRSPIATGATGPAGTGRGARRPPVAGRGRAGDGPGGCHRIETGRAASTSTVWELERLLGLDRASAGRMDDHLLGGGHSFELDRAAARRLLAVVPGAARAVREHRAFVGRAVRCALGYGVRQFLDLGSGFSSIGGMPEFLADVEGARLVCVDADPVAVHGLRERLDHRTGMGVAWADLRDADLVLHHPTVDELINFARPVGVVATGVLHFVPGDVAGTMAGYRSALAPGSMLVVSHAVLNRSAPIGVVERVLAIYRQTSTPLCLRSPEEITRLLAGWEMLSPTDGRPFLAVTCPAGAVPVERWRPDGQPSPLAADPTLAGTLLGGVGRKPGRPNAGWSGPLRQSQNAAPYERRTPPGNNRSNMSALGEHPAESPWPASRWG